MRNISNDEVHFVETLIRAKFNDYRKIAMYELHNDEDAVSECMLDLWEILKKQAHKIALHPNPYGFLYVTFKNCIKMQRRKLRKKNVKFIDISLFENLLSISPHDYEEAPEIDDAEILAAKDEILSNLSDSERSLYEMRFVQKMKIAQIASQTNVSEASVKYRLKTLKNKIEILANNIF